MSNKPTVAAPQDTQASALAGAEPTHIQVKNVGHALIQGVPPSEIRVLPIKVRKSAAYRAGLLTEDLSKGMPTLPFIQDAEHYPERGVLAMIANTTSLDGLAAIKASDTRPAVQEAAEKRARELKGIQHPAPGVILAPPQVVQGPVLEAEEEVIRKVGLFTEMKPLLDYVKSDGRQGVIAAAQARAKQIEDQNRKDMQQRTGA